MRQLQVCNLEERVAPLQASDTMILPVIAVFVIGAIIVVTSTGAPPEDCSDGGDCHGRPM
jgi:hypothetical protein